MFEDGYLICLINGKIYIFDDTGHILYKSDNIANGKTVNYYSLNIKDKNNYFIGFTNDDTLNLYYYEYDKKSNEIINIAKSEDIKIIQSKGMIYNSYYTI